MSWDATLTDDRGHLEGVWDYTHNVEPMVVDAIRRSPELFLADDQYWYQRLNGATGPDGRAFLAGIVAGLEADPDRYRAMNPPNGWGDYDGLLKVLREMRDRVPTWPTAWSASG